MRLQHIKAERQFIKNFDKLEKLGLLFNHALEIYHEIKNSDKIDYIFCNEVYEPHPSEERLTKLIDTFETRAALGMHNNGLAQLISYTADILCLFYSQKVEI